MQFNPSTLDQAHTGDIVAFTPTHDHGTVTGFYVMRVAGAVGGRRLRVLGGTYSRGGMADLYRAELDKDQPLTLARPVWVMDPADDARLHLAEPDNACGITGAEPVPSEMIVRKRLCAVCVSRALRLAEDAEDRADHPQPGAAGLGFFE